MKKSEFNTAMKEKHLHLGEAEQNLKQFKK